MTNKELSRYFGRILAEEIRLLEFSTAYALVPISEDQILEDEDTTAYSVVTHPQGSWKWQKRHALVSYRQHTLKNGKQVWKRHEVLNTKVTSSQVKSLQTNGYRCQLRRLASPGNPAASHRFLSA